jgi:methylmalonyl-CoA mutase
MGKRIQANDENVSFLRERTATYFKLQGRRPRIMITRIPPNGSERIIKRVAAAFADIGFDVDINLSILPPAAVARIAVENDVHVIGIPCLSFDSEPFVTELLTSLNLEYDQNILVVAWLSLNSGGLSTSFDPGIGQFSFFGPQTAYGDSVSQILDMIG